MRAAGGGFPETHIRTGRPPRAEIVAFITGHQTAVGKDGIVALTAISCLRFCYDVDDDQVDDENRDNQRRGDEQEVQEE